MPPKLEKEIRDQKVEKGEQFKIKIPFSGTGPFDFKVKANGRELREGERIKISTFDDYITLIVKGVVCEACCLGLGVCIVCVFVWCLCVFVWCVRMGVHACVCACMCVCLCVYICVL